MGQLAVFKLGLILVPYSKIKYVERFKPQELADVTNILPS